jgi:glycerophosphoryl diester phosphodiesterase
MRDSDGFLFCRPTPDLPPVIGHRGAAGSAPENTLAGLRQALALGCSWVEFDVRLTADGELILLHDDDLDRTTDGHGKARALALAAIRSYDAGNRFDPAFAGERVPTLAKAIEVLAECSLGANVELKAARNCAVETALAAADVLDRLWPPLLPAPLISSFVVKALAAARTRAPRIPRGIIFRGVPGNWRHRAESLGCSTISADHRLLWPGIVAEMHEAGYPVLAYTVNNPVRARELFGWGVTSVISDMPHLIFAAGLPCGHSEADAAMRSRRWAHREIPP